KSLFGCRVFSEQTSTQDVESQQNEVFDCVSGCPCGCPVSTLGTIRYVIFYSVRSKYSVEASNPRNVDDELTRSRAIREPIVIQDRCHHFRSCKEQASSRMDHEDQASEIRYW
ncbi:hypothetical protein LSH36_32g06046, partial [Paralvinella palmiformis]